MAQKSRNQLKQIFVSGAIPTQQDYHDLIESYWNFIDDGLISGGGGTGATGPTGPPGSNGATGATGSGGGGGLTSVTYSGLTTIIGASGLTAGNFYLISDFQTCYDQPDFDYNDNPITVGNYKQGPVEPILVLATSNNTISEVAFQPQYPKDLIKYDWTWNTTEVTGSAAFGRITERIDEFNNRTDYDHRNILFKRYRLYTHRTGQPLNGTIEILAGGAVNGSGTSFTNLSIGDVIYVPNVNPSYYEILTINDDVTMTVTGDVISTGGPGLEFYKTIEETNGTGYFSYKQTNVKSYDFVDYTTFGDAISSNYVKNTYIGNYANNYNNIGSGIFILSNNVFLEGQYESNKFGDYCYNNTFGTDNQNNVWGDYCYGNVSTNDIDDNVIGNHFQNNLINTNLSSNQIGNYFENNKLLSENSADFENNIIGNNFSDNIIYSRFYSNEILLGFNNNTIGDFGNLGNFQFYRNYINNNFNNNIIRQDFQNNKIGTNYQSNIINGEFKGNNILNGFNNNRTFAYFDVNNIGNGFSNNTIYDGFYQNKIHNYFGSNIVSHDFYINDIGDYFGNNNPSNFNLFGWQNLSNVSTRTYTDFYSSLNGGLGNKILGKELVMQIISTSQYFKIIFTQWTQGGNGGGFQYERQEIDSSGNTLGPIIMFTKTNYGSEVDLIVPGVVEITRGNNNGIYNIITEVSWNSGTSPGDTQWNSIYTQPDNGRDFSYNKIKSNFQSNTIGSYFGYNLATGPCGNSIGDSFSSNTVGSNMFGNNIGHTFQSNTIGNYFAGNTIDNISNNNTIGDNFGYNISTNSILGNTIGGYFTSNTIGDDFFSNSIGDYFDSNTIGNGFQRNRTGNYFGGNNSIGTDFQSNQIGDYFIGNNIANEFQFNEIGSYFGNDGSGTGTPIQNVIFDKFKYNKIGNFFGNDTNFPSEGTGTNGDGGVIINTGFMFNEIGDNFIFSAADNNFNNNKIGNDFWFNVFGPNVEQNVIGNLFVGNGGAGGYPNAISGTFISNRISNYAAFNEIDTSTFNYNQIGEFFGNAGSGTQNILSGNFENNNIGDYFGDFGTHTSGGNNINNFYDNLIGNKFYGNDTSSISFWRNDIGNEFFANAISGSDFQNNTIENRFNNNAIGSGGIANIIGAGFNNNIINGQIGYNKIFHGFNNNTINGNLYNNEIGYYSNNNTFNGKLQYNKIGDYFEFNNIGDNFFYNQIGHHFERNYIGNYFGFDNISGYNNNGNIIGNYAKFNFIGENVYGNTIGNEFFGNVIGNGTACVINYSFLVGTFTVGEKITNGPSTATILSDDGVSQMTIGFIDGIFYSNNSITGVSSGSAATITSISANYSLNTGMVSNSVGNNFRSNIIYDSFTNNTIENDFSYNTTDDVFILNHIGTNFTYNNIGQSFSANKIGNNFLYNYIGDGFGEDPNKIPIGNIIGNNTRFNFVGSGNNYNNQIGNSFIGNVIGNGTSCIINYTSPSGIFTVGDIITNGVYSATILTDDGASQMTIIFMDGIFDKNDPLTSSPGGITATIDSISYTYSSSSNMVSNVIENNFGANYILDNLQNNTIKSEFGYNNLGDYFIENYIEERFSNNDILDYFRNNKIAPDFDSNITNSNFQWNTFQKSPSGIDFAGSPSPTHVYNTYNCTIFEGGSGNLRLSYINSSDALVIANITD